MKIQSLSTHSHANRRSKKYWWTLTGKIIIMKILKCLHTTRPKWSKWPEASTCLTVECSLCSSSDGTLVLNSESITLLWRWNPGELTLSADLFTQKLQVACKHRSALWNCNCLGDYLQCIFPVRLRQFFLDLKTSPYFPSAWFCICISE